MHNIRFKLWLEKQPKEFVEDVLDNKVLGDGQFTLDRLRELDQMFNPDEGVDYPEDENERSNK